MRRYVAELTGTALLLAAVVGSRIMGERLAAGNVAIAPLANTLATGATLVALILTFGPISGAHFNLVVSFADASQGGPTWLAGCGYSIAQVTGAIVDVLAVRRWRAERVHSEVVEVMRELGLDISNNRPQRLTEELARDASFPRDDGLRR